MAPVTVTRTFEVPGYASSNGILCPDPLPRRSGVFSGGGYDWSIVYFPDVVLPDGGIDTERIGLDVFLMTKDARVRASLDIALLDPTASLPPWKLMDTCTKELIRSGDGSRSSKAFGVSLLKTGLTDGAPGPGFLTRGGLLFHCTITVFTPAPPAAANKVPSAASDMAEQLGKMYATAEGWDVKFLVEGKEFRAHKIVLAMRSPVFRAELYGPMLESRADIIEIKDMRPYVFEAFLRYIYTDTLPTATSGQAQGDIIDIMCCLLLAADRYCVERLRLLCEQELGKALHVENVARMVVFADDHHCNTLRDACIEFFATSGRMDEVEASEDYLQLRSTRLSTLLEVLEKANKYGRC